ncbi:type IA DNA topoisomerase [Butyrivibrio sp.]|uniref:type IA DNA topoisomerase n=1 Tax=Butyrivibrio sp. TaxID=28121 RepID=UPI0025BE33CF|nr:type IA DNA topoisomerase [Butyrivibrio sp.]MBQ7430234.1 DUF3945 domain-containing protein [Butyrivibrio sp.]MBQ9303408.1 DUF3945 domain-containing protein [Butyrivibrio sp.]
MKKLFIAEKPSVAAEYAKTLGVPSSSKKDGFYENDGYLITWCVGHLVTMSYPDKYDEKYEKWSLETLPFIPQKYLYEVIQNVAGQYKTVAALLNRDDVSDIYFAGDSAREGEYIGRLIQQKAGWNKNANLYRVWIDSQTEDEIKRGIREAKPLSAYDTLADSAYARAIEDYLVGINFSRALTLRYSRLLAGAAGKDKLVIAVGRVMSCVLGLIVAREREIRNTTVFPFYSIKANITDGTSADWKITEKSKYFNIPENYENKGLLKKEPVEALIQACNQAGVLTVVDKKTSESKKSAPLLFNLAELQAECTKKFHISPAQALQCAQDLYEAKMTTYPRTDARVLTTAISKEIQVNLNGLKQGPYAGYADTIMHNNWDKNLLSPSCKYVDDSKVSDHYAIIPTGQGNPATLSELNAKVYDLICRRFLSIFYPEAVYDKLQMTYTAAGETFTASYSALKIPGYLEVAGYKDDTDIKQAMQTAMAQNGTISAQFEIKEGQSQPPKRYTTGSMILAMENAGNLIEEEDLRAQIKGSGIGTSATRAEVISKLESNGYIQSDKKTQTIRPTAVGEMIYDVLNLAMPQILVPKMTASWEAGLQQITDGTVTKDYYLEKINQYVAGAINMVKQTDQTENINQAIAVLAKIYKEITPGGEAGGPICECPNCHAPVKAGKFGAYCTNKCGMNLGYAFGKALSATQVKALCSGEKVLLKGLTSKNGNTYDLYVTATGLQPYSYTNKDGQAVQGVQFAFATEFPAGKKKFKKKG